MNTFINTKIHTNIGADNACEWRLTHFIFNRIAARVMGWFCDYDLLPDRFGNSIARLFL